MNANHRPASDSQKRYVVSLYTKVMQLDPTHQHFTAGYVQQRQYAQEWVSDMTAQYASLCIDALKDRLAGVPFKTRREALESYKVGG